MTVTALPPGGPESANSPCQIYPGLVLSIKFYRNTALTIHYIWSVAAFAIQWLS